MRNSNQSDNIGSETKKYRELIEMIVVQVEDASVGDHEEQFRSWFKKNQIFIAEIERLKKDSNEKSKITAFLLETQYIEFKLTELLNELAIIVNTDPDIVKYKRKIKAKVKKKDREYYELSLGQLCKELLDYEANFLKNLISEVKKLNTVRVQFAHYIFKSIKGIDQVIIEAIEGIILNEKVIEELSLASKYIEEETWYGKMIVRKRVSKG